MDGLHVVDVKSGATMWVAYLSNGKVVHVSKFDRPDELSAYAYVTNRIKEKGAYHGTYART